MGNIIFASKLDLSNKSLSEFPKEILKYKNLKKLNLSNNSINSLPAEIANLKRLKVLDISNNNIAALGAKMFDLKDLEVLIVNGNKIRTLPKQIGNLAKLKNLSCSGNKLDNLPEQISSLKKLRFLNISNNPMVSFPDCILNLSRLETLSINKNKFNSIPKDKILDCLPLLKRLYCFSPTIDEAYDSDRGLKILQREKGNAMKMLKLVAANVQNDPQNLPKMKTTDPNKHIFISYSHQDVKYKDEIEKGLKAITYAGFTFSYWVDTQIASGDIFKSEIANEIAKADIVIFIVSINFMSSKFIQENELPALLHQAKTKGTRFLILIARKCPFKHSILGDYQTVNTPDTPMNGLSEHEQDAVYVKLVEDVISNI